MVAVKDEFGELINDPLEERKDHLTERIIIREVSIGSILLTLLLLLLTIWYLFILEYNYNDSEVIYLIISTIITSIFAQMSWYLSRSNKRNSSTSSTE